MADAHEEAHETMSKQTWTETTEGIPGRRTANIPQRKRNDGARRVKQSSVREQSSMGRAKKDWGSWSIPSDPPKVSKSGSRLIRQRTGVMVIRIPAFDALEVNQRHHLPQSHVEDMRVDSLFEASYRRQMKTRGGLIRLF
ncbi:hypothetical protein N7457_001036 [Penicillium paradoxum]|uniref:uncharacterized protein n=1 Tax=Penicillium paradoxum TaxID=176176 RepID=UPI0025481ECF|nr:uncharacterized protein N7457_001036 [Penicillium paradoxum]KAJ5794437.1 hypothetical protein N7457_001036 [Penicillium paradoxum]